MHPLLHALQVAHAERPLARARDDAERGEEAARAVHVRDALLEWLCERHGPRGQRRGGLAQLDEKRVPDRRPARLREARA